MLKALFRYFWPQDPEKTQIVAPQVHQDCVSRGEFEAEIQKLRDRVEWDLSEWYDKFSTLHARTAKRQQRQKANGVSQEEQHEQPSATRSVLAYRKPWSV